jgi:hypothetical protein
LKEAVPRLTRARRHLPAAAAILEVTIVGTPVRNQVEIEGAITALAAEPDVGLLLVEASSPPIIEAIGRLALYHQLPLNRPGGNLTGVPVAGTEIAENRLKLLYKAVPASKTIALLASPADDPYDRLEKRHIQSAAHTLGLRLLVLIATTNSKITVAFATLVEHQAGAILVGVSVIGLGKGVSPRSLRGSLHRCRSSVTGTTASSRVL